MSYLDGKPVEECVLNEIKLYEERLKKRLEEVKDKELVTEVQQYNEGTEMFDHYPDLIPNLPAKYAPFPVAFKRIVTSKDKVLYNQYRDTNEKEY